MHEILASGVEFIVWLQQYHTPLSNEVWEIITNLGGSNYLYLIPLVIWCVDYRTGQRLLAVFAFTLFLNTTLKTWIAQPRPFQVDPRVISHGERGYGLPSGHAQLVVAYWGVLAHYVARPWFWALSVALMALIGFSRIYLGVHFPSDVALGWALGGATLWAFIAYRERVEALLRARDTATRIQLALAVAAGVLLFDLLLVGDTERLIAGVAGLVAGAGLGSAISANRLAFDGRGHWWQRTLRYLFGIAIMLLLLGVMRKLGVPDGILGEAVVAIDLLLLGLWLTFAAPWLFERTRLWTPDEAVAKAA